MEYNALRVWVLCWSWRSPADAWSASRMKVFPRLIAFDICES